MRSFRMLITPQSTLAVCLMIMAVLCGIWDIYVVATGQPTETVSNILGIWSSQFPILPLTIGVIMGHLFWPRMPVIMP